jgi:hypothetical protein
MRVALAVLACSVFCVHQLPAVGHEPGSARTEETPAAGAGLKHLVDLAVPAVEVDGAVCGCEEFEVGEECEEHPGAKEAKDVSRIVDEFLLASRHVEHKCNHQVGSSQADQEAVSHVSPTSTCQINPLKLDDV